MAIKIKRKPLPETNILNSTGSYDVNVPLGDTKVLDDEQIELVDVNDVVLSTYSNPLYEDLQIDVPVVGAIPASGIQYQRPLTTGQTTSYALYDDADRAANNPYPSDPSNPETVQGLVDFYTLKYDNAFGNRLRFTDASGNNGTDGVNMNVSYCIDNLTGLGWGVGSRTLNKTFDEALTECEALIYESYSDWFLPNMNELYSLFIYSKPSFVNSLILRNGAENVRSSTTNEALTTQSYHNSATRQVRQINKTGLTTYYPTRYHF